MMLFRRAEIPIRCPFRGATMAAPKLARLIDACPEASRGRLQRRLMKIPPEGRLWSVSWRKGRGDDVHPRDVVAVLALDGIVVELVTLRYGVVAEPQVQEGVTVAFGGALAKIGKPVKAMSRTQKMGELLAQYASRHIRDLEEIKRLQSQLSEDRKLIGQLRGEILSLRGRQNAEYLGARIASAANDRKFRRLKQEFSKHYHPDARAGDPDERRRRELVFQEFWPIVEQIERS
jgi:pyruvate/2-oxoglutarate dehydrogenase complex dihydrolipoamide acyltransferase (E2) component